MHSPRQSHVKLVVIEVSKVAPGKGVSFTTFVSEFKLNAFVDVDWGKCLSTRLSVIDYCLFLGNSLVFWSSKKVSRSSK